MTIEQAHQGGIAGAHACFERVTGKKYQLHWHRIFHWEKFLISRKFTEADIETVVRYLHREIEARRTYPPVLWFSNLIEQPDRFEEYLNEGKAKARNAIAPKTDRESVLTAIGKPVCASCEPKVVSMSEQVRWHLEQMREAVNNAED